MRVDRSTTLRKLILLGAMAMFAGSAGSAWAQRPLHYFHSANLPPGTVGQGQLQRFLPLRGYYQPVEISAPQGARISVNVNATYDEPLAGPRLVGMQVGHVYQLKISNIPLFEDFELFPTIEVINRLYPPEGKAQRFPIPIQFTQEELELAVSGRFVTRVIYLEDQTNALPQLQDPDRQPYFEVGRSEDPLRVADQFGRPMLIMRIGSRVPGPNEAAGSMGYGAPTAIIYPPPAAQPVTPNDPDKAIERQGYDVPRVRVPRNGRPAQPPFVAPQGF